ncbi:hypothetical protein MIMGU_mgv11b018027mg [Erythranthe guttata]|uniref:Bromo domain-containing protein n=1 Tax=Erythranthe guttata TaxID=4155 RepID=A0A022RPR7_ERYGU|nr:hypothetical protein MIMGU_mgv11b018027mg [Erythranthe guttata]
MRRSPRISALDACKPPKQQIQNKKKTNKKRKFDDYDDNNNNNHVSPFASVSKLAKQVWKGRDNPLVDAGESDHSLDCTKTSVMPAKHLLELVLDTLQRRDTYEIFAEPVDPNEVEDYCEIIKEPMDFGTMRAKLHEGMYKTLEQFEGRAIHDLASKVFDVLKTDPENFVSEFSGTRRRSMRKTLSSHNKDSIAKLRADDVSLKGTLLHSPSTSTFPNKNLSCAGATNNYHARNIFTGGRDGKIPNSQAADSLSTYEKDPIGWMYHNSYKKLFLMNERDIRYKESLMSYVKGLGPIAKMVAKRKLQAMHHESKNTKDAFDADCASPFKTFRDFAPATNPFLNKAKDIIDLTNEETKYNNMKEKTDVTLINTSISRGLINTDLNCSSSRKRKRHSNNRRVRPVILALENNSVAEYKTRNKKSCIDVPIRRNGPQSEATTSNATAGALVTTNSSTLAPLSLPSNNSSPFTFDLPFLKARLNQMNASNNKNRPSSGRGLVDMAPFNSTRQSAHSIPTTINHFLFNQSNPTPPSQSFDSSNLPLNPFFNSTTL